MSKTQSQIPSPSRSQGAVITPRRARTRRTLSVASPARSDVSTKMSSVVEKFINNDKFTVSPMKRRSVLPDDTDIEAPRRASWWKRLEGSSRDVLEALDTNKMPDDLLIEEYEFEVEKEKEKHIVSESSDNESVASIIVPQRRLFNQKKQTKGKFGDIMGSRKSLGKTNIEDVSIDNAPKNLFNKGPRNRPIFPAALLNSTNKTINKTVEPEPNKPSRPNLFGQAGTKRKNMFTDFVLSESEEDSEIQQKSQVFGFKKYDNKRMSLGTRNRRMPSLTPSMTTEIDIDDWNLLPSSTMIGQEGSRIITDMEVDQEQDENQDKTLIEENASLNPATEHKINNLTLDKGDNKTLINEKPESPRIDKYIEENNVTKTINKSQNRSVTEQNKSVKEKSPAVNDNGVMIPEVSREITDKDFELIFEREGGEENAPIDPEINDHTIRKSETIEGNNKTQTKEISQNVSKHTLVETNVTKNNKTLDRSKTVLHESAPKCTEENSPLDPEINGHTRCKSAILIEENNETQTKDIPQNVSKQTLVENNVSKSNKTLDRSKTVLHGSVNNKSSQNIASKQEIHENIVVEKEKTSTDIKHCSIDNELLEDEMAEATTGKEKQISQVKSILMSEEEDIAEEIEEEYLESEKEESQQEEEPDSEKEDTQQETEVESENEESQEDEDPELEKEDTQQETEVESEQEESEQKIVEESEHESENDQELENDQESENDEVQETSHETTNKQDADQESPYDIAEESEEEMHSDQEQKNQEKLGEVVNVTTGNKTARDTTGINRKNETEVKSPEMVLQNLTKDNESFRPIGRSTSFRKSKSVICNIDIRPSLATVQESIIGSEGSRNSSTEGSGWDSHRTTRKTIRQTYGKDFTPRKSLRTLVMEQSAKRQTEIYNKNVSKLNKTKNKTIVNDANEKDVSNMSKTKTVLEDANNKNASVVSKMKNKTALEDINNHLVRDRRVSNRNLSSNQLSPSKSPGFGTSAHHVSDPLISKPQVSYHKSVIDISEPEVPDQQISQHDEIIDIPQQANNDSGPEISIHASYGQGMSGDVSDHEVSAEEDHGVSVVEYSAIKETKRDISRRDVSKRAQSMHVNSDQEILDYEASDHEKSDGESEAEAMIYDDSNQENSEHDNSALESSNQSAQEEEKDDSEQEQSQNEVEPEQSEYEEEFEEEVVDEESQQEEDPVSEQEESQQDMQVESEEELVNEQDDMSNEKTDVSQGLEQEREDDVSDAPVEEMLSDNEEDNNDDSEHIISGLNSQYKMSNSNRTERIVFDNEMSEQEIDYELSGRMSRQITENDISEEVSKRQPTLEVSKSRVSEVSSVHDVSMGTKKSMLLMQMQKIVQQNMEIRQKIRDKVQSSLKPARNFNIMSPIHSKFSIRRINKSEPKKPKSKPKPTGIPADALPKDFVEDLMYKPPKRFQPATAPWITKRLYKFLETKLEPKYDYRARVRAEELVQTIHSFTKLVRRRDIAPQNAVDELKREMARLHVVNTHFEFYDFFHEFMPREIRVKVNPDVVNKIPMPRNGVFGDILAARVAVE